MKSKKHQAPTVSIISYNDGNGASSYVHAVILRRIKISILLYFITVRYRR